MPKPVVLALFATETTQWRLKVDPEAEIAAVVVGGFSEQLVSGSPVDPIFLDRENACIASHGQLRGDRLRPEYRPRATSLSPRLILRNRNFLRLRHPVAFRPFAAAR